MAARDLSSLDRQIETLMKRDKLPEAEVKALCEKVRPRGPLEPPPSSSAHFLAPRAPSHFPGRPRRS
jgi:hypothetical protein